jgi:adenine deaminase
MKIFGRIVDIHNRDIYKGCVTIDDDKISRTERCDSEVESYILPGLIDAHIHIESSMVTPGAFAVEAIKHGTLCVVSDPHEIVNVCGIDGLNYMIEDAAKVPVKFYFGAPSCVPATSFETSGSVLDKFDIAEILKRDEIHYLSEMMNYPGVIYNNEEVVSKLMAARMVGKPVDGHAPGLSGKDLKKYIDSGISTDHECTTIEEALEKISMGMKILIREGSAAKSLDSLKQLYYSNPEDIMLCCDDLHPEMLMKGHINKLVARLISEGFDIYNVYRSASINPMMHYNISTGLLREGDSADFIIVKTLETMEVLESWIGGRKVFDRGNVFFTTDRSREINNFNCKHINGEDITIINRGGNIRIIEAKDGELLTQSITDSMGTKNIIVPDVERDYLKIIVKDRYNDTPPAIGIIKGFMLKEGAFASSIAHDSHNIICIGTNDHDIVTAVNTIVDMKGGLAVSSNDKIYSLQLNIGGIMTSNTCRETALKYDNLSQIVKSRGCIMSAPFMTLAFMALLVIPELKIGDKGLFNVNEFKPVSLFCRY